MCRKTDELIYVTKNGYGDMVIMSMEVFERTMQHLSMYRDIRETDRKRSDKRCKNCFDGNMDKIWLIN